MNKFSRTKARLERRHNHAAKSNPAHYFPSIHARQHGVVFPATRGWAARATTKKAHSSLRFENGDGAFNRAPLGKLNKPEAALFFAALWLPKPKSHLQKISHAKKTPARERARRG